MAKRSKAETLRVGLIGLAVASMAATAFAHDVWIQPSAFRAAPNTAIPTTIFVGHGDNRQAWGVAANKLARLRTYGPDGVVDHKAEIDDDDMAGAFPILFKNSGVHILLMESGYTTSTLPALRFNEYLAEEGLTPAIDYRRANRQDTLPGREIYSRRAKAMVQIGTTDAAQPLVTTPLGLSLELVPGLNPFTLKANDQLPVKVLLNGRPLAGATVKLNNLDDDSMPVETHISDASGQTRFRARTAGKWQLNVIWTKPLENNPQADFDTTFSSLTFSFATGR